MKLIKKKSKLLTTSGGWARGLMFSRADENLATIFIFDKVRFAPIHMLFVNYQIDVLWLDEKWFIRDIKQHVKPWSLYTAPSCDSKIMIEFVAGTVKKNNLKIGQKLSLKKNGSLFRI